MSDYAVATLRERHAKAKSERSRLEPWYDDAIRLTMPARKRYFDTSIERRGDDIYDETGANAVQEFVSRIQAGVIPSWTRFVHLQAGPEVSQADRNAVNRDLAEIEEYLFEQVWLSNFAQEAAESFHDLAICTACLLTEDGGKRGPFNHQAIPITDFTVENNEMGQIGGIFREMEMSARLVPARYPLAKITDQGLLNAIQSEQDKPVKLVHYTFEEPGKPWSYRDMVWVDDFSCVIMDRDWKGVGANPFTAFRWGVAAGETWGRGPLMNALAAIKTTNLVVELVLENAAMNIVGIYQSDNEGIVNAEDVVLMPGTILTKEVGSAGLEQVQTSAGNFNVRDVVLQDQRLNIRKAMYNDMLADPNKTPATAYEVSERMADLAMRTAGPYSRIFYEFIQPQIDRWLWILEKRGDITLPVYNKRQIRYQAVSPLAQAQQARLMQSLTQDFQIRAGMFGPQMASSSYDFEYLHQYMIEAFGLDQRIYNSAEQVVESMRQQAEQAQAMAMQEQAMKLAAE